MNQKAHRPTTSSYFDAVQLGRRRRGAPSCWHLGEGFKAWNIGVDPHRMTDPDRHEFSTDWQTGMTMRAQHEHGIARPNTHWAVST